MISQAIEQYARGGPSVAAAIRGLSAADFHATPVPGTWSIQQIVIHLMDSDLIGADRMKRVIAEENPTLIGYNETLFIQRLYPEKIDPFVAAEIFDKNRQLTTIILRQLPPDAFDRAGTHNEVGRVTLAELLVKYVHHLDHHMTFLQHKKRLLGK